MVDCGHGLNNSFPGKVDPGATWGPYNEHEVVSSIAQGITHAWQYNDEIAALRLPELSRSQVAAFANGIYEPGDLFLSLHLNSSSNPKATGTEVVIARTAPPARFKQAEAFGQGVAKVLRIPWRRVLFDDETPAGKANGLTVLRQTKMPAMLLEVGFLSNGKDREAIFARGLCAVCEGLRALKAFNG